MTRPTVLKEDLEAHEGNCEYSGNAINGQPLPDHVLCSCGKTIKVTKAGLISQHKAHADQAVSENLGDSHED